MEANYCTFPTEEKPKEPKDRCRTVYLVFYYTGLAILFPYTMLITVTDFWNYKWRDVSLPYNSSREEMTEEQKQFPNQISMAGNVPLTLLVLITLFFGHHVRLRTRLLASLLLEVIAMAFLLLIASLDTDQWQSTALVLILLANAVYSSANAIFQASFLGNLGRFPPTYIGGANDGMGLGTALPALVAVLVLALDPPSTTLGLTGISTSLACLLLQIPLTALLPKSSFYRYHSGEDEDQGVALRDLLMVLSMTWPYQAAIFLDYMVTLAVHPAVTALIQPTASVPSAWHDKYFVPVCCFLAQALADWLGRSLATISQWPRPGRAAEVGAMLVAIVRAAFLPLLMFCNVAPLNRATEVIFPSDVAYVCFLVIFSIAGGYLSNVCYMLAPKKGDGAEQEIAGILLTTFLVLGLGVGSIIGPLLVQLL